LEEVAEANSARDGALGIDDKKIVSARTSPAPVGDNMQPTPTVDEQGRLIAPASVRVGGTWTIRQGDTVEVIANDSGVSVDSLLELNPQLDPSSPLVTGASLSLPPADPYILAARYEAQIDHRTGTAFWDDSTGSEITPGLRDALIEYASTKIGQDYMRFIIHGNHRDRYVYDSNISNADPQISEDSGIDAKYAYVSEQNTIFYNPNAVFTRTSEVRGTGIETNRLSVSIAHEIGHTRLGWQFRGVPPIELDGDGSEIVMFGPNARFNERRAVAMFENPARRDLGLEVRRTYYNENDVERTFGPQ
jgi:LysM repeat protein